MAEELYIVKKMALNPTPTLEEAKELISRLGYPTQWVVVKIVAEVEGPVLDLSWIDHAFDEIVQGLDETP